jgi:cyclic beta-1,2-glucan synthetase
MNFRPLFDRSRMLFHIGIETEKAELTRGWYDLLASEARLLGYIAVSLGQVPRKHWRRLGRAQVQCDGYRGMASWTGTMFEYLMPELCLPLYRESLLYESSRFCLYVQKKRTAQRRLPWGASESAFFSLDPALNYRYKAPGCARLALRRGMDAELVISPYSSFLALPLDPAGAVKNLRNLETHGARGPYGFWEAVDFTSSRCHTKEGLVVRCVMAHHLGMSMVSLSNCLLHENCRRRFLRDPAMAAHAGLLQEKLPLGGVLLRRRDRDMPDKPRHEGLELWMREGAGVDYINPYATLLSNGLYNVMLTESGISRAMAGPLMPYRSPGTPMGDGCGLALYLRRGGELIPLLPLPEADEAVSFRWRMDTCKAVFFRTGQGLESRVEAYISPNEPGEVRLIALRALSGGEESAELLCLLEPVLDVRKDYVNHPSYSKLGIKTEAREGALVVRRLPRGKKPASFLCVACDRAAAVASDGWVFPGRGGLWAGGETGAGWQSDAHIAIRVPLTLRAGAETRLRIAVCLGAEAEEAYRSAKKILAEPAESNACLTAACAGLLGMSASEVDAAMEMLKFLVFPRVCAQGAGYRSPEGRQGLWRLGISGDMPIVCAELKRDEHLPLAESLLRRHALLQTCGLPFDLVFVTDDGGDYRRPRFAAISAALRKMDREALTGIPGGIHFVDATGDLRTLYFSASAVYGAEFPETVAERVTGRKYIMSTDYRSPVQKIPKYEWNEDGSFTFYVNHSLPPRTWGNLLTNGSMSYWATDCGTGSMWYKNARECTVTPWKGDALAVSGPETLELVLAGRRYPLFAGPEDTNCRVTFDFGAAVWEKEIEGLACRLTAFIPPERDVRIFLIECDAMAAARIAWCAPLQYAPDPSDAPQCAVSLEDGLLRAENPRSPFPDTPVLAGFSEEPVLLSFSRPEWLAGEPATPLRSGEPCFGAVLPARGITVIACGCAESAVLRALCSVSAAQEALEDTKRWWRGKIGRLHVDTPDPALNHLLNGWCQYQAIACRCLGRSSVYQSGGAIGFRDQLQDYVNLITLDTAAARAHILNCCAHQFEEGDVQHWWHPGLGGTDKGVRTRCSDDLLWLPWALCEYVEATGDTSICSETVSYLRSPVLSDEESARYETPERSEIQGSVLEHCKKALELVLRRGRGREGLLLIGGGDWNDGFDMVGAAGLGESVWLTWFYSHIAHAFGALLSRLGEDGGHFEAQAEALGKAADGAWDGQWYLRGRFDDGAPLGSRICENCRIDSIAQSFSALCPEASPEKRKGALDAALELLLQENTPLVKLFEPPFEGGSRDPGYIVSYGPGFRENGGQYTHGALWLAMAFFLENRPEDGYKLLRCAIAEGRDTAVYGLEPFVLAADIYANPDCPGRGGWSWYTGSAGWFFRVALRNLLGLRLRDGKPELEPCLPADWSGYTGVWTDERGQKHEFGVRGGQKFINCAFPNES